MNPKQCRLVALAVTTLCLHNPAWAADDELDVLLGTENTASQPAAAPAPENQAAEAEISGEEANTEAATPAPRRTSRLVEEIVVTAQKREEKLQDVPIAISAFSPEKLDAFGIESAQDLERITPGLTITNQSGFSVAYLRGIGTDAFLPGADSSVPFYLDGIALLSAQGSSDTLGRIKRIEVLKGPQGTLFGRNATGGAISIITPDPGNEFSGDLKLEYADFNERNILGYVEMPLGKSVGVSLSGYKNERDNYYTNTDGPIIDVFSEGWRGKLRWDVSNDFSVTLSASGAEASNNAGLTFEHTRVAPVFASLLPQDPKADRVVSLDSLAGARNESELYALTLDWSLPWVDLKLIGSDQFLDAPFVQADFDKSNLPIVNITSIVQESKQKTWELQVLSNEDTPFSEKLEWVAGLYYLESSGGFDPIAFTILPDFLPTFGNIAGLPNETGPAVNILTGTLGSLLGAANLPNVSEGVTLYNYGVLTSDSISAYFQGTYALLDSLDLTLGVRYQEEKRNLVGSRTTQPQPDGSEIVLIENEVPELDAEQLSPRVALQWRPFDSETQFYASWARAFKSPTYNTVNVAGDTFDPIEPVKEEKVDSTELGVKTTLFDSALQFNAAVFRSKQEDLLTGFVSVASGGVVTYDNAGNAKIKGGEFDFLWTPFPNWNPGLALTGAYTYLDTEYTEYPDGRGYDDDTGLAFGDVGTTPLPPRDFKGNRIVRTPEKTYTLGINQYIPFGNHAIEIGVNSYYNSGFFFLPQNSELSQREEYTLLNANISYFYEPWGIQVTAFGRNITDEVYNEVVFVDDFGRNQVLNDPRVYGVRLNWTF